MSGQEDVKMAKLAPVNTVPLSEEFGARKTAVKVELGVLVPQ